MAKFSFVTPSDPQRAGGGAVVAGLIGALRRAGHEVTEQAAGTPCADRITVIDGLALPHLPPEMVAGAVAVVHHTSALADAHSKPGIVAAERALLPLLRHVVATNAATAARLRDDFGVAPDRVSVMVPGAAELGRSGGSGGPGCAILSVGALVPRKGHAVLLAALGRLFDLDWSLVIIGDDARDPGHAAALRAQAEAPDLRGRVRFLGSVDAMEPYWQAADLFALASAWEGYPSSTAEALQRGLPVAVTAPGGTLAMVDPASGVVAEVGDCVQLSKAMRRIIYDPALRADMADAAWGAGQKLPRWADQAALFAAAVA